MQGLCHINQFALTPFHRAQTIAWLRLSFPYSPLHSEVASSRKPNRGFGKAAYKLDTRPVHAIRTRLPVVVETRTPKIVVVAHHHQAAKRRASASHYQKVRPTRNPSISTLYPQTLRAHREEERRKKDNVQCPTHSTALAHTNQDDTCTVTASGYPPKRVSSREPGTETLFTEDEKLDTPPRGSGAIVE